MPRAAQALAAINRPGISEPVTLGSSHAQAGGLVGVGGDFRIQSRSLDIRQGAGDDAMKLPSIDRGVHNHGMPIGIASDRTLGIREVQKAADGHAGFPAWRSGR